MLNVAHSYEGTQYKAPWHTSNGNNAVPGEYIDSTLALALDKMDGHGLADLNKANLMDRVDVKFLLPRTLLPWIIKQMSKSYSVLEIEGERISRYFNQYFDTPDMQFYHQHHNGKLNRFKVRQRSYLDTDTQFLEVKFKNNQKRTLKSRIACGQSAIDEAECHAFIQQKMACDFDELQVIQQSGYRRIALANEESAERLTLDFDLWFRRDKDSDIIELPDFFIAELKQSKRSKRSPFYQLMSQHCYFPTSFSKYCIGCALVYNNALKANQFKTTLAHIKQFSASNSYTFS